ncbi:MAG: glycoside hydrolase family 127 protein [Acidobacteriaceae bacterium]|nr:glycoside hydrolase family 127 protein [Acidobacteriaceae bacterium]
MTDVRLLPSIYKDSEEANLRYLKRLDAERLLHNFRVNAGIASSAQPLGGWEKPDCELRGHFVGHYLSACALMFSSTGDRDIKGKGDYIVSELAKCQAKLPGGYLSAFPLEFFDRLNAREKVWAPFYTIHKIMAGMYDMHEHCGNQQALQVLEGMAKWADNWSAPIPEPHMQDILNTEYGGMNEVLYNLAAATGNDQYAVVGDRFTKKRFFNPLALRRDELRGLHVNTHIPQVIGAARRYELSSDERFHDVADFFWWEVTSARAYVTGGTSNGEAWLVEPRRLGAELKKSSNTTECCCAYNMLKLTRKLYEWTADPRYFDYYERTLLNHRIAAIDRESGATQYYLSIVPGAWKTFSTEDDSFWCCTGTGVEEFSKLNNSIYFHDTNALYVNLFIPSTVTWKEKGLRLRQETDFPRSDRITFTIEAAAAPVRATLHIRVPYWAGPEASVKINREILEAIPSPGSYFTLARNWKSGDRIEVSMPMHLHMQAMPDEPTTQAALYGPLVLAGKLGAEGLSPELIVGPLGPDIEKHPIDVPGLTTANGDLASSLKPVSGEVLTFQAAAGERQLTFVPFDRLFRERYSIYWRVS